MWGSRFALHRKVMVRTCSSVRWWWENHDPWRMDFFFLHAFFGHLHLMMHTTPSHRLAKSLHSPVSIHLSLGCGLPPHVPTTTVARHPPCQEPHVLTPLDGGVLVEEDLSDEAVIAPRRQAHANGTVDGTYCCYCCCHLCYIKSWIFRTLYSAGYGHELFSGSPPW